MKKTINIFLGMLFTGNIIIAADLFITPDGAGRKDGSSWENAFSYHTEDTGMQRAWDALAPGNTLFVGGGNYAAKPFKLTAAGKTKAEIKQLVGVKKDGTLPVFTGSWGKHDANKGFALITIASNSSWWAIENIVITRCQVGITTEKPGRISNGLIQNISMKDMREGIILDGGAEVLKPKLGTHNITVKNFRIVNYTKRGVRIKNGCYNINFADCYADAGGKDWATEPFQMSFSIQGGREGIYDHDITFQNCEARNNYHDAGKGYWNADGFCAERRVYNTTYIACRAFDNTDGGWDTKAINPLLIGCVAIRNKKNYRFWSSKPGAVLIRCIGAYAIKRGGNSNACGLWTGGKVKIYKSSFIGNKASLSFNDWRLKPGDWEKMEIQFTDSIATIPADQQKTIEKLIKNNSEIWPSLPVEGEAPAYSTPEETKKLFDPGTAFDSIKFGKTKGYHSSWKSEQLLTEGRKLQPLLNIEPKRLPAKKISLFTEKKPSGWYYSGWRGARMVGIKGKGQNSSACMGIEDPE